MAKVGSGKFTKCRGKSRSCCKSGRDVPGTYAPDPYRPVPSISCSRRGSDITIVYTMTRDSYSPFATVHFPPQQYRAEIGLSNQGSRIRLTYALVEKSKGTLASSLNSNLRVVPSRIRKHIFCGRRRARMYSLGSCLCCTSVPSNALRVNDGPRLAGVEAAFVDFGGTT